MRRGVYFSDYRDIPGRRTTTMDFLFLPRTPHDTPYRDDPSPDAAKPARPSSPPARDASAPRNGRGSRQKPPAKSAPRAAAKSSTANAPRSRGDGKKAAPRRRRGRGGGSTGENQLTSTPTSRNAYVETRVWLLAQHGPVCAYCGRRFTARVMTLDHVAPRRGQTAYDRRDNLVLACPGCNAAKRDLAPLAFLLGARIRAGNLLRYGGHLSPMLLDMATSLAPAELPASAPDDEIGPDPWDLIDDDGESPYRD